MAVGRDVMGADGLTNAQRYAKRQADARARQAAFNAQKKPQMSYTDPSSGVGFSGNANNVIISAPQPSTRPATSTAMQQNMANQMRWAEEGELSVPEYLQLKTSSNSQDKSRYYSWYYGQGGQNKIKAWEAGEAQRQAQAAAAAQAASVSRPSSMFGGLIDTVKKATTPAPTATLGFGHEQQPAPIKTPPPPPKKTPTKTPDRAAAIAAQQLAAAQAAAEARRKAAAQAAAEAQRQAEAQAAAQETLGFGHEQTTQNPPPPPVNEGMLTPLEQLKADGNTKGQQQEQAADDFYGMSNAQREALQGYYDRGIIDPETNLISEEYLLNPENNDSLYQMFIGGFGLGENELHESLISQAQAGWTAQQQAANPYDADANAGLTFGGGSDAGDYVETPPTYVDPPTPPIVEPTPPPPQEDPDVRRQQEQDARNKAFMDFLKSLGLSSLVDLFNGINVSEGGLAGSNAAESTYTPYTPQAYEPSQVNYDSMLTQANDVGYDPYRGLYNVPDAMKSTADQLGLFSYVNTPQATPMAPYDPMAGITVPTIDYDLLNQPKKEGG